MIILGTVWKLHAASHAAIWEMHAALLIKHVIDLTDDNIGSRFCICKFFINEAVSWTSIAVCDHLSVAAIFLFAFVCICRHYFMSSFAMLVVWFEQRTVFYQQPALWCRQYNVWPAELGNVEAVYKILRNTMLEFLNGKIIRHQELLNFSTVCSPVRARGAVVFFC